MHLLCIVCVCSCKRSHMCLCTCVLRGKGRTYHRGEDTEVLKWITVQPVNSNTRSVLTENRFLSPHLCYYCLTLVTCALDVGLENILPRCCCEFLDISVTALTMLFKMRTKANSFRMECFIWLWL